MPGETEAIAAAKRLLANRIETSANGIDLVALAQREWSDASLGCPETGKAYAQIITPGFLIRLRSGGVVYSMHMDAAGKGVVCIKTDAQPEPAGTIPPDAGGDEDPGPEATMPPDGGGDMGDTEEQAAVAVARSAAAQEANVDMNQTSVASVEPRDWSDSSLGCPQPGMSYLQVITPGYLVIVGAGGRTYEVHTDAGKRAVVCHTDATPTIPRDELVSLVRSGGLTGDTMALTVYSDGWVEVSDGAGGVRASGQASEAHLNALRTALSSKIWQTLDGKYGKPVAADGYTYTITSGGRTVETYDAVDRPVALEATLSALNVIWGSVPTGQ